MIDEKRLIEELSKLAYEEAVEMNEAYENNDVDYVKIHNNRCFCYDHAVRLVSEQPKTGEWIPCSERLPEKLKHVLVWYEYFRYGDYNRMFQTYGIGWQIDGFWCGDVMGDSARCIAWQPLPEAYQEPIGEDNCINNCQEAAGV